MTSLGILGVLLSSCMAQEPPRTNILVLLTDDQGIDQVAAYGEHPNPPATPRIDALADQGVLFRNAWAYPTCSPARAALLTGRLGRRTGVGDALQYRQGLELRTSEAALPAALATAGQPL